VTFALSVRSWKRFWT